jgi:hypothetical protein
MLSLLPGFQLYFSSLSFNKHHLHPRVLPWILPHWTQRFWKSSDHRLHCCCSHSCPGWLCMPSKCHSDTTRPQQGVFTMCHPHPPISILRNNLARLSPLICHPPTVDCPTSPLKLTPAFLQCVHWCPGWLDLVEDPM